MRSELKEINEIRDTFTGEFVRTGWKSGYKGDLPTLLLINVRRKSDNKIMTDHLWFNLTKRFEQVGLNEGDKVQFDARVKKYEKGYRGYREDVYKEVENDYKLSHPTKIIKIS